MQPSGFPGSPPLLALGGGAGGRDLGNEVVVKRDGCTQAIVSHYAKKSCRGEKWEINHSQAFGSWKKLFFVVTSRGIRKQRKSVVSVP